MTIKTRERLGFGLAIFIFLMLAASAVDKISGSAHSIKMTTSFGIPGSIYKLLGIIELGSAILFLNRRTGVLGTLLIVSYMGGAIATHLQHQQDILFPIAIQIIVWITAAIRFPELIERILDRPRS